MRAISFYDADGRIISTLVGDDASIEASIAESEYDYVDGEWYGKPVYVLDGVVTDRPANTTTLNGLTLENVPVPAVVRIGTEIYDTNEATVELSFPFSGTYNVTVISFPYLDKEFQVENPAS